MKPTLLEVTLRDGGYQNNWGFSQDNATALVRLIYDAGIEHIEIGYRNGVPAETGVGLTGKTPDDYVKAIREEVPKARLSVMYSPKLITEKDLETLAGLGVAMVRCSMPHIGAEAALPLIKKGVELGMISTANMTNVTEYKMDQLVEECNRIIDNGVSVLYIADSNGSMTPESVTATFAELKSRIHPIPLGFHNHNMLGMAMANAMAATEAGVEYLDCSLRGMGRSAGNVPTESILSYLAKTGSAAAFNLLAIFRAARYLSATFSTADPHPTLEDAAFGTFDFDTLLAPLITEVASEYDISWFALIDEMSKSDLDKPAITLDVIRAIAERMVGNSSSKGI